MNSHARIVRVMCLAMCLLPCATVASSNDGRDPFVASAAINIERYSHRLDVDVDPAIDIEISRIGLEIREPLREDVDLGLELGYSESERNNTSFGVASGQFGGLGIRYRPAVISNLRIRAEAQWRMQRDDITSNGLAGDVRIYETRAWLVPEFRWKAVTVAAGGAWRKMDYRERLDDGSLSIRADTDTGIVPFAALSVHGDDGAIISLQVTDNDQPGLEPGWRLKFERNF
jgi:hypothetical protein